MPNIVPVYYCSVCISKIQSCWSHIDLKEITNRYLCKKRKVKQHILSISAAAGKMPHLRKKVCNIYSMNKKKTLVPCSLDEFQFGEMEAAL